tara:strand:- start:255 stop:779 length:525 start_codon:yes stop_codon:yes gene_type:complete
MNDKEKRIKEQRLIEAAEKNYLGASGKLGSICRYLGEPIKGVGGSLYDSYEYSFDSWGEEDPEELPTAEMDESVYDLGYLFDGLSRGMHLEVKYLAYEKKLTCHYKGHEVYKEKAGELMGYAPFDEWETLIDKLYKIAQTKARKRKVEIAKDEKAKRLTHATGFLQKIRERWGL